MQPVFPNYNYNSAQAGTVQPTYPATSAHASAAYPTYPSSTSHQGLYQSAPAHPSYPTTSAPHGSQQTVAAHPGHPTNNRQHGAQQSQREKKKTSNLYPAGQRQPKKRVCLYIIYFLWDFLVKSLDNFLKKYFWKNYKCFIFITFSKKYFFKKMFKIS